MPKRPLGKLVKCQECGKSYRRAEVNAALLEALQALYHAVDRLPTVQSQQDMAQWWDKTRHHAITARAAIAQANGGQAPPNPSACTHGTGPRPCAECYPRA